MRADRADMAIRDFTEAIVLNPSEAINFNNRGAIYRDIKQYDRSLADLTEALRLNPEYENAYINRGITYIYKHEIESSRSDFSEAIKRDKHLLTKAHLLRGITNYYGGHFEESEKDFRQIESRFSMGEYAKIWIEILLRRNSNPAPIRDRPKSAEIIEWPAPINGMLKGELLPDAVVTAARDKSPKKTKKQMCEAAFYIGQYALLNDNQPTARTLLREAQSKCASDAPEALAAFLDPAAR